MPPVQMQTLYVMYGEVQGVLLTPDWIVRFMILSLCKVPMDTNEIGVSKLTCIRYLLLTYFILCDIKSSTLA